MNTKPKLRPTPNTLDQLLESAGWIALTSLWAIAIYHYSNLPDTIPTHYNFTGQPDRYGGKAALLVLPVIGSLLFAGMTVLGKRPHLFNYPRAITAANALQQYALATRLLRFLKLGIILVFLLVVWDTIAAATGQSKGLGWWSMIALPFMIVLPAAWYIIKAMKAR